MAERVSERNGRTVCIARIARIIIARSIRRDVDEGDVLCGGVVQGKCGDPGQQPRRQRCARAQDLDLTLDDKEGNRLTQVRPGPACGTGQVPDAARRMGGEPEGAAMVVLLLMRQPFQQHRVALTAHLTKKGGGGKRRVGQRKVDRIRI